MKSLYCLVLLSVLLASCSSAPSVDTVATSVAGTVAAQQSAQKVSSPTAPQPIDTTSPTATQESTTTITSTPTATTSPTITLAPSMTITPTQDLSFYNVAFCIPKNTSFQIGTVTRVRDGDTIYVSVADGKTYEVRYIGVDSPESERPFAVESLSANSDLVLQKEVIVIKDISETDQFDRLLRYVIVDNVFVNLELVRMGLAVAEDYPPDIACSETLSLAEDQARASQNGMWVATQTPEPLAPKVIILTVNKREEWVEIQNVGNTDVELTGWNLVSEKGNQDCPLSGIIEAGKTLRIWAMAAQGPGYSCGYNTNIWNNSEPDPAVLYNAQGVEVSRK